MKRKKEAKIRIGDIDIIEMNEEEDIIKMRKEEKRGIIGIMVMYLIAWGLLVSPWWAIRFVSWIVLGLIGFTLWRVLDGLYERSIINIKEGKDGTK